MEVVFILVPVSLALIVLACWAFVWSVRHDQFEELEDEAQRILFDEEDQRRQS